MQRRRSLPVTNTPAKPLPTLSVGAPSAVYAMRRLVGGYAGPLFRLVRISDSVTRDIYANRDGSPNILGVAAFLGGAAQALIDTRYDQTGGGNHETQTTSGSQPFFTLANAINGRYSVTFDGDQNNAFLTIPAGVTGSGRSVTRVDVCSFESTNAACVGMTGAAWNTAGSLTHILGGGSPQFNKMVVLTSSTFVNTGGYYGRSQPQVSVVASGAADIRVYQDGQVSALAVNNAGTYAGGFTGKGGPSYFFYGEHYATIYYPAQVTATDATTLMTYLSATFGVLTTSKAKLVCPGNSIVQGTKATLLKNVARLAEPLFTKQLYVVNAGVFGQLAASQYADRAVYGAMFDAGLVKNLILAPEPTNDINAAASGNIASPSTAGGGGGGGVGTNCWANYTLPFIQYQQAIFGNANVLVPTTLPRSWGGSGTDSTQKEAERNTYNGLIASNQSTYGYTVVDFAAIASLSNPANTTYYADGTHPTSTGYALMAQVLAAAVNSLY